jgi:S-(hydroxymethyl)glutathione dehydrogenase/alcohol dehydrogenase
VIQGARLAGAKMIIAIDKLPSKLALAQQFGATHVVLADDDTVGTVTALCQGGVDHAFEAIGLKATQGLGYSVLGPGGQLTLIGLNPAGHELALPGALAGTMSEKRVQGSFMGSSAFQLDLPRYASLYLQGRLKLDELISARLQLAQVNDGFEAMKSGAVARSVVVFEDVLGHASAAA